MRTESDFLGPMELPDDAYYGVQTARAMKNFRVSGITVPLAMVTAYAKVKKAAALANRDLGDLDAVRAQAIVAAADQILAGKHLDQFRLDVFQAGAGTSLNMNVNEVIANLALESMGRKKGDYEALHPNDHVNRSQSSNDTYPTALHLAALAESAHLLAALVQLERSLRAKSQEFAHIVKGGRTHLMDAMPVTLGQEFRAFASTVARARRRIEERRADLRELAIGGTAVGTGINAHPGYRASVLRHLSDICGEELRAPNDSHEAQNSKALMVAYHSSLKEASLEILRICDDLRLMNSGPSAGFGEIALPAVQPGSSIMPGKVNPSMPECMGMICYEVIGNDASVAWAGAAGQLELNVMTPFLAYKVLLSTQVMANFIPAFAADCIDGIVADEDRCRHELERNPILVTVLTEKIGYEEAAELVKEARRTRKPVAEIAVRKGLITAEEAAHYFDPQELSRDRQEP